MIEFTKEQEQLLHKMTAFMLEYNKKVNLTAIKEPEQVWEKHYIDSAFPLILIDVPRGTQVIDVGTGAGFPGVIWKIYRPDLEITLLDSLRKRVDYLKLLKAEIGLEYEVVHGRSEELACLPLRGRCSKSGGSYSPLPAASLLEEECFRERFGVAVSRAVANLPALCELCLPFVKVGGIFLAMKGSQDELKTAGNALALLGGDVEQIKNYKLPCGDKRTLIIVKKVKETPPKYPRQRMNITKNPL